MLPRWCLLAILVSSALSYRVVFPGDRLVAQHRAETDQTQFECSSYSFNLTRYQGSGVISAFRTNGEEVSDQDTDETSSETVSEEEEQDKEDKISYSALFWPLLQRFKAPNVVRCEEDSSLPGCKELLAPAPPLGSWQNEGDYESSGGPGQHVPYLDDAGVMAAYAAAAAAAESSHAAPEPAEARSNDGDEVDDLLGLASEGQDIILDGSLQNRTAELVSKVDTLDHGMVSQLPGCYPLVMPFVSAVTAAKWQLATSQNTIEDSSPNQLAANVSFESQADFSLFIEVLDMVKRVNKEMASSHNYSEESMCQSLGMMGSYLGVSLAKDLRVAECEARTDLPICWQDAKDYLANHTEENKEFTFENLTVDSMFFNYEDYSLTVGEYNLTLENFDLDYNITETAYAKIESLTGMTNSLAEYKDQMVGKLRTQYDEVMKSRIVAAEGFSFDLYSPDMDTVNMLRAKRMIGHQEREATTSSPSSTSHLYHDCQITNSSNVQRCWEEWIKSSEVMDADAFNSYLAAANLALISYSTTLMVAIAQGVQMLSLASFILAAPVINTLYGGELYDADTEPELYSSRLSCAYDIIMQEDLTFDSDALAEEGTSLMQLVVRPFGRRNFGLYPYRLLTATTSILANREDLVQGLTNITAAVVDKLSDVVAEGELAAKVSEQARAMRDWLLGIDVLEVLEAFVEFVKAVMRACWRLRSGGWPELVALVEEVVTVVVVEDTFWSRLGEVMEQVVGRRWELLRSVMVEGVEPMVRGLVEGMEALAEDVEGQLAVAADMVRECDGSWLVTTYGGGWGTAAREALCGEGGEEEVLTMVLTNIHTRIAMVEPSFSLFAPETFCSLFGLCEEDQDSPLRRKLASSGLHTAWRTIYSPLVRMKRAVVCHAPATLERRLWQYVLY